MRLRAGGAKGVGVRLPEPEEPFEHGAGHKSTKRLTSLKLIFWLIYATKDCTLM